jgi:peptide/nickel transport system substrate-binding protein
MKKMTPHPIIAALLLFMLAAPSVQGAAAKPRTGGTLTLGIYRDLELMNPLVATRSIDEDLRTLMFEPLLGLDAKDRVRPRLAESWDISKDGTVYTFKLRKGVKFHDGRDMTAEDVKFSMEYTMNPKNGAFGANQLALVERVETPDAHTVRVYLKRPSPAFLSSVTQITTFSVIPGGSLEEGQKPTTYPPGTGPFRFVEWQPKQRLVFERFDGYWGPKALVDRVVMIPILDDTARITAVRTGDVDIIERTPREWVRQIVDGKVKDVGHEKARYSSFRRIVFNVAAPPFDDKRVRRAVAHAINRKEILDAAYFGLGEPNDQKFPKGNPWHIEGLRSPAYDPAKARALLKETGYKGEPVELLLIQSAAEQAEATALQAQLKKIGIPLQLSMMDSAAANSRFRRGEFTLRFSGTSLFTDPSPMYGPGLVCEPDLKKRATNSSGYCDKEMEALLAKAETELDPAKRKALFRQVVARLFDDVPELFLGFVPETFTFRRHVKGFTTNDDGNFQWSEGGLSRTWLDK